MMKRIVKIGLCLVIAIFLIAVSLLVVCNTVIVNNAKGKLYSNVDSDFCIDQGDILALDICDTWYAFSRKGWEEHKNDEV